MKRRTSRVVGPRLAGKLGPLDPRTAAWREDLADIALVDRIAVQAYAEPRVMQVQARSVPLRDGPGADAVAVSELLFGERFAVLDITGGKAWGYGLHDHYVGTLEMAALAPEATTSGEAVRIGPCDALLFAAPAVKAPVLASLPVGALLTVKPHDDRFFQVSGGPHDARFLHRRHVAQPGLDWVDIARSFVGAPYRWGGRTRAGVDCSGVLQVAMQVAGMPARRDSDMLIADAGPDVSPDARQYGDIAWWPGHIGVLLDRETLLHATAHWMACVVEPLADVVKRAKLEGGGGEPVVKRPRP